MRSRGTYKNTGLLPVIVLFCASAFQVHAQSPAEEPVMVCAAEAYSLDQLISALANNGASIPPEMSQDIKGWFDALSNAAVPDVSDGERGMAFYNLSKAHQSSLFKEANEGHLQTVIDGRIAIIRQCMTDHVE